MLHDVCERLPPVPSDEEAYAVVEPYYLNLVRLFREKGLKRISRTRLEVERSMHDSPRHFTAARDDGMLISVAPQIVHLPVDNLVAILAHECGHAADFLYPVRFQVVDDRLVEWEHPDWRGEGFSGNIDRRAAFARTKQWKERSSDELERTADAVAERVLGRPIYYGGPCVLQSFEGGVRPRPVGLT